MAVTVSGTKLICLLLPLSIVYVVLSLSESIVIAVSLVLVIVVPPEPVKTISSLLPVEGSKLKAGLSLVAGLPVCTAKKS